MKGAEILELLKSLVNCGSRYRRREWIMAFLQQRGFNYTLHHFVNGGVNIIINKNNRTSIILSAHYDGDDPNDNLSSVAILLQLLNDYGNDRYAVLLTDLEEKRARGMEAYIEKYGTKIPIIVLELCGVGNIVHLGTASFIPSPSPCAQLISMDQSILSDLERCVIKIGYEYRKHLTPPGDHLHYALHGGRAALLSIVNEVDFEVISRMCNQIPPYRLFDGIDRNTSVILRIPPFGSSKIEDIMPESLEKIYNILIEYLKRELL